MVLNRQRWMRTADVSTIIAFIIGLITLGLLIWFYVRPIPTADIKVPVATDQATYSPGEDIGGLFFGEIYYKGEVRILREVFCSKDYKRVLPVPADSLAPGGFYATQSEPRVLEGTNVPIGVLPDDMPIGANCVIKFTNVYRINTPFGLRVLEYNYYTQNFAIVSDERRQQLDCEATGRADCDFVAPDAQ